jgi:hypothetical protein
MGQTNGCTLATVKGSYGVLASGTILGVGPITGSGIVTANGAGGLIYSYIESTNGVVISGIVPGTYTLNSNCSGTVSFADGQTFAAVVVTGGQEIDLMSTTASDLQTAVAKRVQ